MRLLGYVMAILALACVLHRFNSTPADWVEAARSIPLWLICGAVLCFAGQTILNAVAFCRYVEAGAPAVPRDCLFSAWRDSLLAKYLPGGIWQIASRWLLLRRAGVRHGLVVQASLFEQGLALGLCALLGGTFWLLARSSIALSWLFVVLPLVALALWMAIRLMCWLAIRLVPSVLRRFGLPSDFLDIGALARMALTMLAAMLPFAFGYVLIFTSMLHDIDDVMRLVAAIFLATSAGLAVVFVPGGLGLRESLLPVLFALHTGDAALALALGVVARVVLMFSEVCVFMLMNRFRLVHA